jgi:hypothetical protein
MPGTEKNVKEMFIAGFANWGGTRRHARKSFAEEWKIFLERHGLKEYAD